MSTKTKGFPGKNLTSRLDRIGLGGTDQKQIHFKSFELAGFLAVCQSNLASFMAAGLWRDMRSGGRAELAHPSALLLPCLPDCLHLGGVNLCSSRAPLERKL